jgi:DNA-directed RNA polymerase specialized sigma24 family protein
VIVERGVLVPAPLCAPIAPLFEQWLDHLRRQGYTIHPAAERVAAELRSIATADRTADGLPTVDEPTAVPASWSWITTAQAAAELGTKERNIVDLISRGQLIAEKVSGAWRVDTESVRARVAAKGLG